MKFRRFTGRDAREALDRVRAAFGSEAIILKNRPIPDGIEILATLDDPDAADRLELDAATVSEVPPAVPLPAWARAPLPARRDETTHTLAASADPADITQPPAEMSTVSFQQYLRDRVSRAPAQPAASAQPAHPPRVAQAAQVAQPAQPAKPALVAQVAQPAIARAAGMDAAGPTPVARGPEVLAVASQTAHHELCFPQPGFDLGQAAAPAPSRETALMAELRSMQGMLAGHLTSMAWLDGVRRNPAQAQILRHLMACGFSGGLARRLADRLPASMNTETGRIWLSDRLRRVIQIDAPGQTLIDRGGIYAVTGPTGVGKTTTIAKLAAQFALRHGVDSIGLVSVDAYRIGAQEQLRAFGRLLGVSVMVAHDAGSLAEFLHVFMRKKLVLIDTVGFGQRDERVAEQLRSLAQPNIQRLLVLNAAAQSDVTQSVIAQFRGSGLRGAIITKLDETVKAGIVLDAVIRHRLPVIGTSNGQRVPEDWQFADAAGLVDQALSVPPPSPVQLEDHEMSLLLQEPGTGESLHA